MNDKKEGEAMALVIESYVLILIYYLSTFVYGHAFDLSIDISTYKCLSFQHCMPLNQLITNKIDKEV